MIIREIEINNIGRHKKVHVKGVEQVAAFIGANGDGKSTCLAAIEAALTLNWKDTAATYVRNYSRRLELEEAGVSPDAAEYPANGDVRLRFDAGECNYQIYNRVGKSPKSWFQTGDDEANRLTKAVDIKEALLHVLGSDCSAVSTSVFVPQGELDKAFYGTPMTRVDHFIKVLNLDYMRKKAEAIDGKIQHLQANIPDLSPLLEQCERARSEASDEVRKSEIEASSSVDWSEDIKTLYRLVEITGRERTLRDKLPAAEQASMDAGRVLTALLSSAAVKAPGDLKLKRQAAEFLLTAAEKEGNRLRDIVENMRALRRERERHAAVELEIKGSRGELSAIPVPKQGEVSDIKALITKKEEAVKARSALESAEKALEAVRAYAEDIGKKRELLPQLEKNLEGHRRSLRDKETSLHRLMSWVELQRKMAKARENSCVGEGEQCTQCGLVLVGGQEIDEEKVAGLERQMLEEKSVIDDLRVRVTEGEKTYNDTRDEVSRFDTALTNREADLQLAENEFKAAGGDSMADGLEQERSRLSLVESASDKIKTLENIITGAEQRRDTCAADIKLILGRCPDAEYGSESEFDTVVAVKEKELADKRTEYASTADKKKRIEELCEKVSEADLALRDKEGDKNKLTEDIKNLEAEKGRLLLSDSFNTRLSQEKHLNPQVKSPEDMLPLLEEENKVAAEKKAAAAQAKITYENRNREWHDLMERKSRDEHKHKIISELRDMRSVLIKDGLPTAYVMAKYAQMVEVTKVNLAALNAGFAIRVDPRVPCALEFCRDEEEVWLPQNKLSGGQKVRLSVAFQLAIQQILVPDVGLLVLDEPSTHLDEPGRASLRDLLMTVGRVFAGSDFQLWVVDHIPEVRTGVQTVIDLGTGEGAA